MEGKTLSRHKKKKQDFKKSDKGKKILGRGEKKVKVKNQEVRENIVYWTETQNAQREGGN